MHHHVKLHAKQVGVFLLIAMALLLLSLSAKKIDIEGFVSFFRAHTSFGVIIYFVYSIISTVIVTLPIVPAWPFAISILGFVPALVMTLVGMLIGASISFWLARRFGQPLVVRMIGKHLYDEVNHLIDMENHRTFLLVRLLGNNYFDTISYIAGLSKLSFGTYVVITTLTSTTWVIVLFVLIQKAGGIENISSILTFMSIYAGVVLVGTIAWEVFHKRHKKHISRREKSN